MMKRRTLADWKQLIELQRESGLSITVFCKQKNLPTSNFYKYRSKLEQNKPSEPFLKAQVIKAKPVAPTLMLLTYGEAKLSLNANCEPSWLADFIKALHA